MTVHRFTRFLSVLIFGLASLSFAQSANTSAQAATKQDTSKPGSSQEVDPLKRELTPKQKEEQRKALLRPIAPQNFFSVPFQ